MKNGWLNVPRNARRRGLCLSNTQEERAGRRETGFGVVRRAAERCNLAAGRSGSHVEGGDPGSGRSAHPRSTECEPKFQAFTASRRWAASARSASLTML